MTDTTTTAERTTTNRPTKAALAAAERADYTMRLRAILPPGTTVYTILRRVSASGMMRHISLIVIEDGRPRDITGWAGLAMGSPWDRDTGGIKVGGCGMDMGFHLVYNLSRQLYPDGFGIEGTGPMGHANRPDTQDKAATLVEKGYTFYGRNGDTSGWDQDGGYALAHRWL